MFVLRDILKNNDRGCYLFWEGRGARVLPNLMHRFNATKCSALGPGNLIKPLDGPLAWLENLGMGEVRGREN